MKLKFDWILDLIYPRFCLNCGKMGEFWCEKCYQQLFFLRNSDITEDINELNEKKSEVFLDKVKALFAYDGSIKKIIHQYKYKGVRDLYETLGFWLYQFLVIDKVDVITYIPIHRRRLNDRGYNQAKLIAQFLAEKINVPCLPLLKRTIYQEKQALSIDKNERLEKSKDIFVIQKKIANKLNRKIKILIIDDVITTGATINQAGKVLKQEGFEKVYGVALAHGS